MTTGKPIGCTAFLIAAVLSAQQPSAPQFPAPQFEVVSIHKVPPNAPTVMREIDFTPILPGGQYRHSRAGLPSMIADAYNLKFPSLQLRGLPSWASDREFDVAAKPAPDFLTLSPAENTQQVRLMLRQMLAEALVQIRGPGQIGSVSVSIERVIRIMQQGRLAKSPASL